MLVHQDSQGFTTCLVFPSGKYSAGSNPAVCPLSRVTYLKMSYENTDESLIYDSHYGDPLCIY